MKSQNVIYGLVILTAYIVVYIKANTKANQLIEKGTKELATGKFGEALSTFSEAIDADPKNHLSYFRRATVYLAMGKLKTSVPDLTSALEINPSYVPARKQRGMAYLKMGKFAESREDFNLIISEPEVQEKLQLVQKAKDLLYTANDLIENEDYNLAISPLDEAVDMMPFNDEVRNMRAKCYLKTGEIQKGLQDLRNGVHMKNDNREGLLHVSTLMYDYGLAVQSLNEIRECLKLDQDDKNCQKHYKMVKKLAKAITSAQDASEAENWNECIKHANKILALEPNHSEYIMQAKIHLCKCQSQTINNEAVKNCDEVIKRYPDNNDYKLNKAEGLINLEQYDEAIKEYQKILENERDNQRAQKGMEKAQRLKKQAGSRDYYKILGVSRNAKKKEIMKAYRKLAAEWHPDKFDEKDKKMAEKKFIDITDSKEVLTDEEKRAQFDQGVDPLDPNNQSGGGGHGSQHFRGNPFPGGFQFNPFESGHFEFHFG